MKNPKNSRRSFVKLAATAAVAGPALLNARFSNAQGKEKLAEDDPTAAALGYKEDTTQVDSEKYPNHTDEQICAGCALYIGDDPEWGGCSAFPGKLVAGNGWCAAYAPKPS